MSFTFATVTATYENPDGSPAQGQLTLTPSGDLTNGLVTIVPRPLTLTLDAQGYASAQIPSTEDPGTMPVGVTWRVDERIDGAPVVSWSTPVPSGGVSVDLSTLRPSTEAWG